MTKKAYFGNPDLKVIRQGSPRQVARLLEKMEEDGDIAPWDETGSYYDAQEERRIRWELGLPEEGGEYET